jgi:hypothetical protein
MDFRRSGAVEALAGNVDPAALAAKMANSIDQSKDLQRAYLPVDSAVVRLADDARLVGRSRLRANRSGAKVETAVLKKVETRRLTMHQVFDSVAGATGLEPATSGVTGRRTTKFYSEIWCR